MEPQPCDYATGFATCHPGVPASRIPEVAAIRAIYEEGPLKKPRQQMIDITSPQSGIWNFNPARASIRLDSIAEGSGRLQRPKPKETRIIEFR